MRKPRIKDNLRKRLEKLEKYTGQDMKTINTELEKVLKSIGRSPEQTAEALTDRELTERNIDHYNFLYDLAFKNNRVNTTLHDYLLEYKLETHGEEIFKEMGFTIVGRTENGDFKLKKIDK